MSINEMYFDNEENIIAYIQSYLKEACLFNGNSFEKKILKMLKDKNNIESHNSKSDHPPDFISSKHNMMFEVMRVNDSETKNVEKIYNPVKERERKMFKELKKAGTCFDGENSNIEIFCNSESDNAKEHSFEKYKENVIRTVSKHLSSKGHPNKIQEIWMNEHPEVKYKGFLIFDETECCFDGAIAHAYKDKFAFLVNNPLTLHEPWHDKDFIKWAYDSDLDFVVWACAYKPYGTVAMNAKINFPPLMIIDVRFQGTAKYFDYSKKNLVL